MCSAPKPQAQQTTEQAKQLRTLLPRSYLENSNLAIRKGNVGGRGQGNGNIGSPENIMRNSGLQIAR